MNIKVISLKQINRGSLKAFVDIRIDNGLTIKDFRIVQQAGQKPWVSVPQQEYTGRDGERKFKSLVLLSDDLKKQVSSVVLKSYENERKDDQAPF